MEMSVSTQVQLLFEPVGVVPGHLHHAPFRHLPKQMAYRYSCGIIAANEATSSSHEKPMLACPPCSMNENIVIIATSASAGMKAGYNCGKHARIMLNWICARGGTRGMVALMENRLADIACEGES